MSIPLRPPEFQKRPASPTLRSWFKFRARLSALLAIAPLLSLPAQVPGTLRILGVEHLPGNELRLVFQDNGTNTLDYRLIHQPTLAAGATNYLDLQARIVDLGGGCYHTIIPRPPESPRFYRITGYGGPDTDGDGLSDALEALIGTNPAKFDTDNDGFGDGVELVRGGNPLDVSSKPFIVRAEFALTSSTAREGQGAVNLAVNLNTNYSGTLSYRIAEMTSAVSNQDFAPVSGVVTVNGSTASIPITLLDDTNMEPAELLAVDLIEDPWSDYQVGGASRHVVQLLDNDTHWSGVMGTTNSAQLGFRLRMLRVGSQVVSAALVSELSTNSSQGVGTIPVGVWPVQASLTASSFNATSDPIPMGNSRLTGGAQLQRWLTFTALTANTNHLVRSNLILGTFTDRLASSDPGMGWIGGTVSGVVVLMEDLPVSAPRQLPGETVLGNRPVARAKGGGQ